MLCNVKRPDEVTMAKSNPDGLRLAIPNRFAHQIDLNRLFPALVCTAYTSIITLLLIHTIVTLVAFNFMAAYYKRFNINYVRGVIHHSNCSYLSYTGHSLSSDSTCSHIHNLWGLNQRGVHKYLLLSIRWFHPCQTHFMHT